MNRYFVVSITQIGWNSDNDIYCKEENLNSCLDLQTESFMAQCDGHNYSYRNIGEDETNEEEGSYILQESVDSYEVDEEEYLEALKNKNIDCYEKINSEDDYLCNIRKIME